MKTIQKGVVNRTYENDLEEPVISVILENGFKVNFFIIGLTDNDYIERANIIWDNENMII